MATFGLQRELKDKELGIRDTPPPESNSHLGTGPPASIGIRAFCPMGYFLEQSHMRSTFR